MRPVVAHRVARPRATATFRVLLKVAKTPAEVAEMPRKALVLLAPRSLLALAVVRRPVREATQAAGALQAEEADRLHYRSCSAQISRACRKR